MNKKRGIILLAMLLFIAATAMFAGCSSTQEESSLETDSVEVTSVTFDRETLELTVGGTGTLTVTVSPQNATNKTVTWTSSDTDVATVKPDGTVTAVGEGVATITATSGNCSATCTVNVSAAQE